MSNESLPLEQSSALKFSLFNGLIYRALSSLSRITTISK
ncbi:hypothetical protein PLIP_a3604 [Pseudoalteromonas lipolytica LMEB 39]|nr:hypothetical protein [Pseudoalteromonas lipolytica LMEB 39]